MDLNYDIDTWILPLYSMALTNITGQIVKASITSPVPTLTETIVTKRASDRVMVLPLPELIKREIKDTIHYLMSEMLEWYKINGECIPLILTMHGLVDTARSARACLRTCTTKAIGWQYEMACDHCLEDDIVFLGRHLSSEEKSAYEERYYPKTSEEDPGSLGRFWYHIHQGRFDEKINLKDLSEQQCIKGLEHAVFRRSNVAIKYFMTVASSPETLDYVLEWYYYCFMSMDYLYTPTIYVAFLKASQEWPDMRKILSTAMLHALLKRPYKHLFLKAAESLVKNLNETNTCCLAGAIAMSISRDLTNRDLFVGFWKMGVGRWSCYDRVSDQWKIMRFLLHSVLLMGDKQAAFMVVDGISQEDKEMFLYKTDEHCQIFNDMVFEEEFEDLEVLVNVCRKRKEHLFTRFLQVFKNYSNRRASEDNRTRQKKYYQKVWTLRLLKFLLIMSKHSPDRNKLRHRLDRVRLWYLVYLYTYKTFLANDMYDHAT